MVEVIFYFLVGISGKSLSEIETEERFYGK